MSTSLQEYIRAHVEQITVTGCWIWMASAQSTGYGQFRCGGKHYLAHRASYEAFRGPVFNGLHVLHRCDVKLCCNPAHLFLGTNQDNIADSVAKITRRRPSGLKYVYTTKRPGPQRQSSVEQHVSIRGM